MKSSPAHEESGNLFFAALDQLPDMILITSKEGRVSFANQAIKKRFGDEFPPILKSLISSPSDSLSPLVKRVQIDREFYSVDVLPLQGKDSLLISLRPEKKTAPHIPVHQKTAENFKSANPTKVGSWSFEGNTDSYDLSDEVFEIFEQKRTDYPQIKLLDFFRFVHPEDLSKLTINFQKVLEGEQSEIDFRILVNGRLKFLRAVSHPVLDEHHNFMRSYGYLEDVTSTVSETKIQRERSETIHKKTQQLAKVGSWVWDTKYKTVEWSDSIFEIFDLTPTPDNKISPDSYYNYIHPDDLEKIKPENIITKPDGTRGYEYRIVTAKGNIKYIFNTEGQPFGDSTILFGTLQDVTHLKQHESSARDFRPRLKSENILAQISMIFNSMKNLEEKINHSLESLGLHTSSERVYIFEDTPDGKFSSNTYEWYSKTSYTLKNHFTTISYDEYPSWKHAIDNKSHFYSESPEIASDVQQFLSKRKSETVLILPLISGKKKIGFVGFDNYTRYNWKELIILQAISTIIADAFHRKSMEEALINREAALREVQKIALITNFEFNLQHREVFISKELSEMSGLDPGWQSIENFQAVLGAEDITRTSRSFEECIKKRKEYMETYRIRHKKTGEEKFLASKGFIQYDDSGVPVRYIGTKQDITQSMLQKLKLEEANTQLENIINNVPGAVYRRKSLHCRDSKFLNDQVKEIFGYSPEDFLPEGSVNFFDLVHETDRETLKKKLADSMDQQSGYEITYRAKDAQNNEKWIWDCGGFIRIGNEKYIQGIMVDITNKVKAEDRILSATLQAEDAERRRISKEINDGVQQTLVSSLLTLQSLENFIRMSADDKLIERYEKGMEMLKTGVGETRDIAYNIMPKSIQDFGLVNTLESMVQLLDKTTLMNVHFYSNFKEQRLNEKTEVSLYRICREAVNNILSYSKASEVSIQLMKHSTRISLHIEDNGIGFDTQNGNLLYSGFGISLMKSRANSVGGTFEIHSRPNAGTNIMVEIPDYDDL